jgi:hypothetical protein
MRHIAYIWIVLSMVFVSVSAFAGTVWKTDKEVRAISKPILDNIFAGFNRVITQSTQKILMIL